MGRSFSKLLASRLAATLTDKQEGTRCSLTLLDKTTGAQRFNQNCWRQNKRRLLISQMVRGLRSNSVCVLPHRRQHVVDNYVFRFILVFSLWEERWIRSKRNLYHIDSMLPPHTVTLHNCIESVHTQNIISCVTPLRFDSLLLTFSLTIFIVSPFQKKK